LMPSPTIPNTWVAPQSISVSIKMSEVFTSAPGAGVGWDTISAWVSEACAAEAARGAVATRPAAAAT
jgi:hypothetical protein